MDHLILRPVTAGSLIKKILAVNPDLGVEDIIAILKRASGEPGVLPREYDGERSRIDEEMALDLARATLPRPMPK